MRHGFIKTAAAAPKVTLADCWANGEEILKFIGEMEKEHAKVMVFPELCITGSTCEDLFQQRRLLDSAWETLMHISEETKNTDALIILGLPVRQNSKLYNAAAVLNRGKLLGLVPKSVIANHGQFYGGRQFTSGAGTLEYAEIDGMRIPFGTQILFCCENYPELTVAAEIGEDLWANNQPSVCHSQAGANLIVNPSAVSEMAGSASYRKNLVKGQSARLVCGYVSANAGQGESTQDVVYGGQGLIAENGELLAEGRKYRTEAVYSEIDVHRINDERRKLSTWLSSDSACYMKVPFVLGEEETCLTRSFSQYPFVPSDREERDSRCEEILNIQAMGLKHRMEHIHCSRAAVGLSGGLDSTLALLVTARAFDFMGLPREQIHCVTMPCFGTTDRTYNNACELSRCLGAVLSEVNIKEAVSLHFRDIGHDPEKHDVTFENSQARERTQVLMDISNQEGSILVGTGDLSELALGWATYNGDHMSMYGVNSSVPKTLVRHLVRYYADTCGEQKLKEVLLDILDTPVSPELLPPEDGEIAQKTEDLVGPYELHDFYLYYMLRAGFEPEKIYRLACRTFRDIYDKETVLKWLKTFYRRFFMQQFKRSCLPDGPKVGSAAVSPRGDLRMPSDANAEIWLKQLEHR